MSIPALKFAGGSDHSPARVELEIDAGTLDRLRRDAANHGPTALVVRAGDLDRFRAVKTRTVDRGTKKKAKALSGLLLGHQQIPVIAGSYTSSAQLCRSVRTLLERAAIRGDRNLFTIGAADPLFDHLWMESREIPEDPIGNAQAILDLLPPGDVPAELARKYIGASQEAQLVRRLIMRAAIQDEPVLIIGETGTGKEVVARAIHDYSKRRVEMFVSVNCAAIPSDLFESELFGHEPESFTGAVHRKPGLWKVADHGTLFLDEIGDLRIDHQAKILRALQENRIRPVGAVDEIPVSARVVAATNRDLSAMVEAGRFREDLYYRLRSFFIPTPPLGQHPDDIPLLARSFWTAITRDPAAALGDKIIEALRARSWLGNARELRAVLSNLHGLFGNTTLTMDHLEAVWRLQSELTTMDRPVKR